MRRILDILQDFRGRTVQRASLEGLVAALLTAAGAVLVAAVVLVFTESSQVRRVALALIIGLPSAILIRQIVRGYRRFPNDYAAAAYLEDAIPALRTDVRTALDFANAEPSEDPINASMRAAQLIRVERALFTAKATIPTVVPQRSLQRPCIALAALLTLITAGAFASAPFGEGLHSLAYGFPASVANGPASQETRPIVSAIDIEIEHPRHTGMRPTRVFGVTGDLRAMIGSTVTLEARALTPVKDAVLVIEGEESQRVQLRVEGMRIGGRFQVTEAATYRFEVVEVSNEHLVDPVTRRIIVIPDNPPSIELSEPVADLEVTPDQIVDLQYFARDDFGVAELSVAWHFAGHSESVRFEPLQSGLSTPRFEEHVPFDLSPMRLQPRDEVVVFIQATDNNDVSEPGVGVSRSITMRVASPDDRNFEVLRLKEELFESLLRQLGGTLAAGVTETALTDDREFVHRPAELDGTQRTGALRAAKETHVGWLPTVELFETLLELMRADELTLSGDLDMLEAAYSRLYPAVLDQGRQLDKLTTHALADGISDMLFSEVSLAVGDTVDVTERTVLVLQDLVATHKADNVQRAMEELEETRAELRTLIEAYRDAPTEELREEIMRELQRLQTRMQELLQQLASQVEQLPTDHLNADAIDQSELAENLSDMTSAMDQLGEMLANNDADGALEFLDQLEAQLNAVEEELQPLGEARPDTLSEFDQEMGAMMDELNNLAEMESSLEQQTQELFDEMLRDRAEEIADESDSALRAALDLIERELRQHNELPKERLSEDTQRVMNDVQGDLERLRDRLEQSDAAGAESAATRLLSQLSDARWELRRDEALLVRDPQGQRDAERAQRSSRGAEQTVRDVRESMRDLMELAQPEPNQAQQGAMQQLGQEQGEVQQRMGELSQQMQRMGERFPALDEEIQPTLQQVSESMQQAQDNLETGRPRPALQGEQRALEGMQQMRQQMQQMTQQQRQRDQRNGRENPENEVEVPEDGRSDREGFRQHVIESMREDSLEAYEDEIRQYYESLLE